MTKPQLLLLHGATGSKKQLQLLADKLSAQFDVHAIDFSGYGDAPAKKGFSIQSFADQTAAYIESIGGPTNIFGYSMGGYVALYLALRQPSLINKIVTLGTKMFWNAEIAEKETAMLNADQLLQKAPAFVESLQQTHTGNDWRKLLADTQNLMRDLGRTNLLLEQDISLLKHDVLLMRGDKDKMVTLEETVDVFKRLPNAKLCILPATPHMIEKINIEPLAYHITLHCR